MPLGKVHLAVWQSRVNSPDELPMLPDVPQLLGCWPLWSALTGPLSVDFKWWTLARNWKIRERPGKVLNSYLIEGREERGREERGKRIGREGRREEEKLGAVKRGEEKDYGRTWRLEEERSQGDF